MALPRPPVGELSRISVGWGDWGVRTLAPGAATVVIVDVLSFSTCVSIAVRRGATIVPWPSDDPPPADAVVAVRREQTAPAHPFSLSPESLRQARPGMEIVLPSPNGAALTLAAAESGVAVVAGCLRNASAVAARAATEAGPVAVIAAGERWPDGSLRPALEDWVGAGAIAAALPAGWTRSPDASAAEAAFMSARADLTGALGSCASGIELAERGYPEDVALAAELDADDAVPLLGGDEDGRRYAAAS